MLLPVLSRASCFCSPKQGACCAAARTRSSWAFMFVVIVMMAAATVVVSPASPLWRLLSHPSNPSSHAAGRLVPLLRVQPPAASHWQFRPCPILSRLLPRRAGEGAPWPSANQRNSATMSLLPRFYGCASDFFLRTWVMRSPALRTVGASQTHTTHHRDHRASRHAHIPGTSSSK